MKHTITITRKALVYLSTHVPDTVNRARQHARLSTTGDVALFEYADAAEACDIASDLAQYLPVSMAKDIAFAEAKDIGSVSTEALHVGQLTRQGLNIYSSQSPFPVAKVLRHRSSLISAKQGEVNTRLAVREERIMALFLAAPEMFATLKRVKYLLAVDADHRDASSLAEFNEARDAVRSAISKAEGTS